jgi:DNA-binding MarR family transcriptional regulator
MPKRNSSKKNTRTTAPCLPDPVSYQDISKVHPALRPYFGYCVHKIATIFKAELNAAFGSQDIQSHHFAILSVIASSSDVNQMKICDEVGIDKASMVKITDHLESLKLIERVGSKEDRRVKNLHITAKGQKMLLTAQSRRSEVEAKFLSALSEQEIQTFKTLMLKILDSQKKNP